MEDILKDILKCWKVSSGFQMGTGTLPNLRYFEILGRYLKDILKTNVGKFSPVSKWERVPCPILDIL